MMKSYAPMPNTPECDCIWKQGLYRGNQVKMGPLGWTLIQSDWCPYEKRLEDTRGECGQRDVYHKPQRKTWNRSFPYDHQKKPTLLAP